MKIFSIIFPPIFCHGNQRSSIQRLEFYFNEWFQKLSPNVWIHLSKRFRICCFPYCGRTDGCLAEMEKGAISFATFFCLIDYIKFYCYGMTSVLFCSVYSVRWPLPHYISADRPDRYMGEGISIAHCGKFAIWTKTYLK